MASKVRRWWSILVLWLVAGSTPALATGDVLRLPATAEAVELADRCRAWVDPSGDRSVDELEAAGDDVPWEPRHQRQLERLAPGEVLWLRCLIQTEPGPRWFLDLGSSDLEQVQLHYRDGEGRWVRQWAGTRVALADWPLPGRVPAFPLASDDAQDGQPVAHWLRIAHGRTAVSGGMVLRTEAALMRSREREQFLLGAYFGMAALVAFGSLAAGLRYRDGAFLAYLAYVLLLATGQLARLGVATQYLWPQQPEFGLAARALLQAGSAAAGLWFVKVVTEPVRLARWVERLVWLLVLALPAAALLDAWLSSRASLLLATGLTACALALVAALVLWSWLARRDPAMGLVALGFLPVLVMALFPLARALDLWPAGLLTRYGIFLGALLEMPLLYYALTERATRRRESELRAAALGHSDALTGLTLRRQLLQRLEATLLRTRSQGQQCALLAVRIANIEKLREEHGRDTVEQALVVAASHLMRVITVIDLAARVGDHEFALLLEAPVEREEALSRAQQIVAAGLRQVDQLPAGATLRFHVVVALLPQEDLDAARTLQWSLDALAQIPGDAKKSIRPLNF